MIDLALLWPFAVGGFALGAASTLHCAGMCGGIASGLLHFGAPRTFAESASLTSVTHAGRVASYVAAGMLAGALGAPVLGWLDRDAAFRLAQWAGAAALMWIGLSTAGLLPPLAAMDRLLAPLSASLARIARPSRNRYVAALTGGLAWGLMPCAMVYGALFTAMLSGSALGGGAVMLVFGMGTLPGLMAVTAGFGALIRGARGNGRVIAGLAIATLGFLTVWIPHNHASPICAPGEQTVMTDTKTRASLLP